MMKEDGKIKARKNALKYIKKLQEAKFDLLAVYIFGSLIKGDFTEWSDVDDTLTGMVC